MEGQGLEGGGLAGELLQQPRKMMETWMGDSEVMGSGWVLDIF